MSYSWTRPTPNGTRSTTKGKWKITYRLVAMPDNAIRLSPHEKLDRKNHHFWVVNMTASAFRVIRWPNVTSLPFKVYNDDLNTGDIRRTPQRIAAAKRMNEAVASTMPEMERRAIQKAHRMFAEIYGDFDELEIADMIHNGGFHAT